MVNCKECGIYDKNREICFHFSVEQNDCVYFIPIQYDGDEALTPEEHWDLKIADMKSRSMRGPL